MTGPIAFSLFALWAFSYFGGYATAASVHLLLVGAVVVGLFRHRASDDH